jgi:hypothetical protein
LIVFDARNVLDDALAFVPAAQALIGRLMSAEKIAAYLKMWQAAKPL